VNFAEYELEQFPERLGLLKSLIACNVIMAPAKGE
jgi:hypothetical protein